MPTGSLKQLLDAVLWVMFEHSCMGHGTLFMVSIALCSHAWIVHCSPVP
jgi:hypothetical protein